MIFTTLGVTGAGNSAAVAPRNLQTNPQGELQLEDFGPLSAASGWARMDNRLYWTEDHGGQWRDITPALPAAASIISVTFLTGGQGWVLWDEPQDNGDLTLKISSTSTGGSVWEERTVQQLSADDLDRSIEQARMVWLDERTGWVLLQRQTGSNFSAGALFHTLDGGQTWTRSALPAAGDARFVNGLTGWLAGGPAMDQLFKTNDTGLTWEQAALPVGLEAASVEHLYPPVFDTAGNGLLAIITRTEEAFDLHFYSSTDAGASWTLAAGFPLGSQADVPLTLLDPSTAVAIVPGTDQAIQVVNGQPQTLINTDGQSAGILDLKMISLAAGWAEWNESACTKTPSSQDGLTDVNCTSETKLLSTEDGGITWTALRLPGIEVETLLEASSATSGSPPEMRAASFTNTQTFIGKGFDICGVPSLASLNIWDDYSPYASMNLYIGGDMLYDGCYRSYLNASYVTTARDYGWTFIPTWVGPQAPCTSYTVRISGDSTNSYAAAHAQGILEAQKARDALAILGLTTPSPDKKGSVVYYDLETFAGDQACRDAVKSFMDGWDYQLTLSNTASGLYASTGCTNGLNNYISIPHPPYAIWGALWDYHDSVWTMGCIPDTEWDTHQRIHQYEGAHNESWGPTGQQITLNIDSNAMDSIVAVPNQVVVPPPPSAAFSATPLSGTAPLAVLFKIDNYEVNKARYVNCAWEYGDGQRGTTCTDHLHTYNQTGSYTVTLTVQGPGGVDDLTRINYILATEPQQSDLVPFPRLAGAEPVIISSSPGTHVNDTLFSGQPVFVDWGFKNIGNASVNNNFQVDLYIDDQRILDYSISGLGANTAEGFDDTSVNWTVPGWHTVRLVLDPNRNVVESNEDNNTWSGQFYWEGSPTVWPTIIGPTGIVQVSLPDFLWMRSSNPSTAYYEIQAHSLTPGGVFFSQNFLSCTKKNNTWPENTCYYPSHSTLPAGDYEFRVGAYNGNGNVSYSPWQVFTVEGMPSLPTNLSPSGTIADATPTFSWNKSSGASWYELYVYPTGSSTPLLSETSIQAMANCLSSRCSWTPANPIDNGSYTLKVRAANLSKASDFSEVTFNQTIDPDAYRVFLPMLKH